MAKRLLDILVACIAGLLLLPLLVFIAAWVRIALGKPVLFRQMRPGKGARPFVLRKFRTMTDRRDSTGQLLPDEKRMHPVGSLLRKSSLDELPELWNVLKGEMSLVGPRPLLMEYLPLYNARQARRHDVRPGITGWAQINGRNAISWEEKLEMDVWYVENQSFLLDLKILSQTLLQLFCPKGIHADGHVTMPPFQGSETDHE